MPSYKAIIAQYNRVLRRVNMSVVCDFAILASPVKRSTRWSETAINPNPIYQVVSEPADTEPFLKR